MGGHVTLQARLPAAALVKPPLFLGSTDPLVHHEIPWGRVLHASVLTYASLLVVLLCGCYQTLIIFQSADPCSIFA